MENSGSGVILAGPRHSSLVASAAPLGFGICGSPPPLHRDNKKLELAFVPPLLRLQILSANCWLSFFFVVNAEAVDVGRASRIDRFRLNRHVYRFRFAFKAAKAAVERAEVDTSVRFHFRNFDRRLISGLLLAAYVACRLGLVTRGAVKAILAMESPLLRLKTGFPLSFRTACRGTYAHGITKDKCHLAKFLKAWLVIF